MQLHRKARLPNPVGEDLEVREPRMRPQRQLTVLNAKHPQESPHLDQRLPPRRLDGAERLTCRGLLTLEHALPGLCLHDHHADRVRDDVVQLTGDPGPLLGDCLPFLLLAFPLQRSARWVCSVDWTRWPRSAKPAP